MQNAVRMSSYASDQGTARQKFVNSWIGQVPKGGKVLDVGAGPAPYRKLIEESGLLYFGHDFAKYVPNPSQPGHKETDFPYTDLYFECDVLDIPEDEKFDLIISTDVFEHIPEPVEAFKKISRLLKPGGVVVITVPYISLLHQAPYWFQPGLSQFWFNYMVEKTSLHLLELKILGDYIDFMAQEVRRLLYFSKIMWPLATLGYLLTKALRPFTNESARSAAGLVLLFAAKK